MVTGYRASDARALLLVPDDYCCALQTAAFSRSLLCVPPNATWLELEPLDREVQHIDGEIPDCIPIPHGGMLFMWTDTQVSAVTEALESVALRLSEEHLSHCDVEAAADGGAVADAKIREANAAIARVVGY